MQITVFGASGRVGRLVVAEALARGHHVAAFIHQHNALPSNDRLRVYQGDIHTAANVTASLQGSQAVISALGSWGTKTKDIVTSGMRSLIPAMEAQGIGRIVSLTGSGAFAPGESKTAPPLRKLGHALAAGLGAGKVLRDGEMHIQLLSDSRLDWTVLRSPVMTSSSDILYRLTLKPGRPWETISRRAVAKCLIDQLEGPGYLGAAPFLFRK